MSKERPRLLVVDDVEADNAALRDIVALYNYEVLEVNDGASALRILQEAEIDAMLISIELPDGGFALSQKMREQLHISDLPLAFVTSEDSDYPTLMEAQFYGGMFLVRKPYADVEVLAQLSSMMRVKFLQDELKEHFTELDRLASTDPLTGLFNRRLLFIRLEQELARSRRVDADLCLIYLDIDHFKTINDTYGHLIGDEILRSLSVLMNALLRKSDVLARMGGEEFLIMLPDTGEEGAVMIAERLREKVEQSPFVIGELTVSVTVSVGVLHISPDLSELPDELVRRADDALYHSKHSGRNKVTVWHEHHKAH